MSFTATQVYDVYEAILRVAPPGGVNGAYDLSIAAQLNAPNGLTLANYETSLITSDQALYTTEAAMVTYDAFYNTMPSSSQLTTIATSTVGTGAGNGTGLTLPDGQVYYAAQELHNAGYSDANVWTVLGADWATDTHSSFYALYNGLATGSTLNYTTFIDEVYQHEFGYLPSATNLGYLLGDIPGLAQLLGSGSTPGTTMQIMGGLYGYLLYAGMTNNVGLYTLPANMLLATAATDEATTVGSSAPLYTGELVQEMAITVNVTDSYTNPVTEGSTVTFSVATGNVAAGTVLDYTLTGVTAAEVVGGSLTGTATVAPNGTASFQVHLVSTPGEGLTGPLTATVAAVPNESTIISTNAASVALTETATTYTLSDIAPTPTTEGSTVVYHIATNGIVPAGETVDYTLTGVTASQVVGGQLTGEVTLVNGVANFQVQLNSTPGEGLTGEYLVATLALPASANVASVGSASVALTETPAIYTITPSGNITEGSSETFSIHTNMPPGTMDSWALSGAALGQVVPPVSGSVTFDVNGNASVTIPTSVTVINGPATEALTFTLSANAQPVGVSTVQVTEATATVGDTNSQQISEGSTANFTLATTNLAPGTMLSYTLSGAGVAQLAVPSEATGTLTVGVGGSAALNVATLASLIDTNGATAPLTLTLNGITGATDTVTVNENATISVASGSGPVVEGNAVTFDLVASPNVPVGTEVSYTLSGAALGNVLPSLQTGTAVVSPGGEVVITIPTLANNSSGLADGLTLTLNNLNNSVGAPTVATDVINETAPGIFVLTTGTDNGSAPGQPFYGNPIGGNNYFATQATLGQNDVLNAGGGPGNTLYLTSSGFFNFITSFTTFGIQTFDLNISASTIIDMSSAFGVTTVIDDNSLASLALDNLQAPVALTILNPSFIFGSTDVTLQYIAPVIASNPTQYVTLVNTLNPITGLPAGGLTANGIANFSIASGGPATNGLTYLASTALSSVVFTATGSDQSFVLGGAGGPNPAMMFQGTGYGAGANVLDLSAWTGTFYDIGNGGVAIQSAGGLTIDGGAGGMNSQFVPAAAPYALHTGGGITAAGNLTINMGDPASSSFYGQQLLSTGGNIVIDGNPHSTGAGFINNGSQSTNIATDGGSVSIQGFKGGLGGNDATITTNGGSAAAGGSVDIGDLFAVTGGIVENINTAGTVHGGVVTVDLYSGTNSLVFSSGDVHTGVTITGGTNTLDFSNTASTGFHAGTIQDPQGDFVNSTANPVNQTLILDPELLGGTASGVGIIDFATGNMTTAGVIYMPNLDESGITQTINVTDTIGATPGLENMTSGDTLNMGLNGVAETYTLNTSFTSNGATLNLSVVAGSTVTVTNTLSGGTLGDLEFTAVDPPTTTTLNISDDPGLTTLGLMDTGANGGSGDFLYVDAVPTNYATITNVNGAEAGQVDNANIDMSLLAPDLSTVGGTIHLGNGNNTIVVSNVVSGHDGTWAITAGDGNNSVTVTPQYGDTDTIHLGLTGSGGDNTINVNGVGGIVNIHTGSGDDTVIFNQSGVNLTDADTLNLGNGYNIVQIIDGPLNENDSIFLNWTHVNELELAAGFNNSMILDVLANANANTVDNSFEIQTGGTVAGIGSTVIYGGAGYTDALIVDVASGGDAGGDTILFNNATNGALTVIANVTDYNTSFESGPTTVQLTNEGVFANSAEANTLVLVADNNLATIDIANSASAGLHGVQTIDGEFGGYGTGMAVWLASNQAAPVTTIDLSNVRGITAVWAQGDHTGTAITITGGYGWYSNAENTLYANDGADTLNAEASWYGITTSSTPNPLLDIQNFLVSGGGANQMNGVGGSDNTGTAFVFNSFNDLINNGSINSYHTATDAIFVPTASVQAANTAIGGSLPTSGAILFEGSYATPAGDSTAQIYSLLDGLLDTPVSGGPIQAVYDPTTGTMYLDIANIAIFNSDTASFTINFASPAGLTDLTTTQFNNYAGTSELYFNGTSVVPDLQIPVDSDITVVEYNFFNGVGVINGGGGAPIADFDGPGGAIVTNPALASYDFSHVLTSMTVKTPDYVSNGAGPVMGPGTITGSNNGDSFFVNGADLFAGLVIVGGSGANQITIDPLVSLTITLSATTNGPGVGQVENVQTLNLVDNGGNTVSFANDGTAFAHINGSAADGVDVINTAYMAQDATLGDSIVLANTAGDTVNLAPGAVADGTPAATIDFSGGSGENTVASSVGGTINTIIMGGGHTTLSLVNGDDISPAVLTGIDTLHITNGASITLTGEEWNGFAAVTSGNGHATVNFSDNVTGSTAHSLHGPNSTYNLGGDAGSSNTLTLVNNEYNGLGSYVPGGNLFSGNVNGGDGTNDTVVVGGLTLGGLLLPGEGPAVIAFGDGTNFISASDGADLGPVGVATTITVAGGGTAGLEITGMGSATVTMNTEEYAVFILAAPGIDIGSTTNDTVVFSDADGLSNLTLDSHIVNWTLAAGPDTYSLGDTSPGASDQNVDATAAGGDTINVGSLTFTGDLAFGVGPNTIDANSANLSGGTITSTGDNNVFLHFNDASGDTVTMTSGQEVQFDATGAMTGGGTNTAIDISDNAVAVNLGVNENGVVNTVNLQASNTTVDLHVGGGATTGWDGGTLNVGSALTNQLIALDNGTPGVTTGINDYTHYANITNFVPGTLTPVDTIHLVADGNTQVWDEAIATTGVATAAGANSIIAIDQAVGELAAGVVGTAGELTAVENAVSHALGTSTALTTGDIYTFIISAPTGAAIFETHASGADTVDGVQLIGLLVNHSANDLAAHNFV